MKQQTPAVVTIFLDFDGVTHSEPCPDTSKLFSKLPMIAEVLTRYDVEVVVSSSWRCVYTIDEIRNRFALGIAHLIVGVTPDLSKPDGSWIPPSSGAARQAEIEQWMKANRHWSQPWIAVDDRASWFQPDCKNLLCTDRETGFTDQNAFQLDELIKEYL